jgi:hypothetical protein
MFKKADYGELVDECLDMGRENQKEQGYESARIFTGASTRIKHVQ